MDATKLGLGGGVDTYGDCPGVCCGCRRCRTERGGIPGMSGGASARRCLPRRRRAARARGTGEKARETSVLLCVLPACVCPTNALGAVFMLLFFFFLRVRWKAPPLADFLRLNGTRARQGASQPPPLAPTMETLDPLALAASANSPRGRPRRRSGRRSGGLENAAPPSQSVTRFGFKKRAIPWRAHSLLQ